MTSRSLIAISLLVLFGSCQKGPDPVLVDIFQLPVDENLYSIGGFPSGELVVVGGTDWTSGLIASKNPGDEIWQVDTMSERLLIDVFCEANSEWAYAVGLGGDFFIRPTNEDWIFRRLPDWAQFRGSFFFPDGTGWLVSGNAWKNGRLTHLNAQLNRDTFFDFEEELDRVNFVDSLHGFATGFGIVVTTHNGGQSWEPSSLAGDWFIDLHFPTSEIGYLVGFAGTIYKTTDAGATWQHLRNGGSIWIPDWPIRAVHFKNASEGMIVGDGGLLRWTNDGGECWMQIPAGLPDLDWKDLTYQDGDWWVCGQNATIAKIQLP